LKALDCGRLPLRFPRRWPAQNRPKKLSLDRTGVLESDRTGDLADTARGALT
jgi:hypothetical protein